MADEGGSSIARQVNAGDQMLTRALSATSAVLTVLVFSMSSSALAQDRWAAIAPNLENSSTVVWATSKDQAKELAVVACKKVSSTCAETPASTNGMDHTFAVMCCTAPKAGCAAAVGATRQIALKEVKRLLPVQPQELFQRRNR